MNPSETLEELARLLGSELDLEACTVARPTVADDPPETRCLNLADDAERFFRNTIQRAIGSKLDPLQWVLRAYDPLYKSGPDEIEAAQLAGISALELATSRLDNLAPLAPFDANDDAYIRRLQYWGVVLHGPEDKRAYFFHAFVGAAELQRKPGAAFLLRNGTFHSVEERIFLFSEGVDCFVFDEYAFVLQKNRFRKLFDQLEVVYQRAGEAAEVLNTKVPIANFDEFRDACASDASLADKVLAIRNRDYFDLLSYEFVKPVIEEFNLQIPTVTGTDGTTSLEFRSQPGHRQRILKLLDDDFLRSSMTEHLYEVNSKTDPPGGA